MEGAALACRRGLERRRLAGSEDGDAHVRRRELEPGLTLVSKEQGPRITRDIDLAVKNVGQVICGTAPYLTAPPLPHHLDPNKVV